MAENEKVIIRSRGGSKLCEIEAPQGWQSWFTIPILPFLGIRYRNVWKEPEGIVEWAWLQSFQIVQNVREFRLISRQTRCQCIVCSQNSITPVFGWLWNRRSVIGFRCSNQECSMFRVTIPTVLTMRLRDMPPELFSGILSNLPKDTSIAGSENVSMVIWVDSN